MLKWLILVGVAPALALGQTSRAERRFNEIQKSPLELYSFLYKMPKGGDLHNHLSGAIYAESFLRAAAAEHLCVDMKAAAVVRCAAGGTDAAVAMTDNAVAGALIDSLSMRDFVPVTGVSGHDHFFATFNKFGPVGGDDLLGEVIRRAADQNESYLELMALSGGGAGALGPKAGVDVTDFAGSKKKLADAGLADAVQALRARVDQMEAVRKAAGTAVQVGYLYQVLREFPKEHVFAQVMVGFALAAADPRVVGVNFVQPEDGLTSMRDYHLHMQMVDFAKGLYPKVHVTLHAGELAPGLVPPEGLRFHIREAVELGHAERIGHGVDVMYEKDPEQLLAEMKAKRVMVEINLTSNDGILGVKGDLHPLPVYLKYGVPVALSTDDEGVSRSQLTFEYLRAVTTYHLSYSTLKKMVRNSIEYSFAPAEDKARLLKDLEARFRAFESSLR